MGLFRKRVDDPDEIQRLRAEIASMGQRLADSETAKQQLDHQVDELTRRVESSSPSAPSPGALPAPGTAPVTAGDLDVLRARIQRLAERVEDDAQRPDDELAARLDELAGRIDDAAIARSMQSVERSDDVSSRLDDLTRRLDAMADAATSPGETVDPEDFGSLQERVDELVGRLELRTPAPPPPEPLPAARGDAADADAQADDDRVGLTDLADLHERIDALVDRIDQVDGRLTSISTELANQLTELGNELDRADGGSVGDGAGDTAAVEQLADELRDAQERLAAEQARYQIAFRQDLAQLADRLRRT